MRKKALCICLMVLPLLAANGNVFFREGFEDLSRWKQVFFPKIKEHTTYSVVKDGELSYLKAQSRASASLLICRESFNPYVYPRVRWRWKVDNLLPRADLTVKSGDDVPIRIYIAFAYDPKRASFVDRAKFNAARLLYGEYPPLCSLNYVWASHSYAETIFDSAYTSRNKMIVLDQGPAKLGTWVTQQVDILADYRKIFGADPPERATIGIMNDSDNTGGAAVSYVADLIVFRTE